MKKPDIKIEFLSDIDNNRDKKFLKLLRKKLRVHFPNGEISEPMVFDMVERNNKDAAAIIPWYAKGEDAYIYLRTCIRPAIYHRFPEEGIMWEIPAGVIDPGETPKEAAVRELMEEMGFEKNLEDMEKLGKFYFSSVGTQAERIYLYTCQVDPKKRVEPTEDGSPLEKYGKIVSFSLGDVEDMIYNGEIRDSKTQLAFYRLCDWFG